MTETITAASGLQDFDFFVGDWTVRHRQLRTRLAGDTEWLEFSSRCRMRKILGGAGNFDEISVPSPRGAYNGATLRLYDAEAGTWSIHWLDSRNPVLEAPMVGRFDQGIGLFHADETFEGRPIKVRFIWTPVSAEACRWEQAFSPDDGRTWETNWIMDFARA